MYVIKGLGQMESWGRSIVPVQEAESFGVYFVDEKGLCVLIAEFVSHDDAALFLRLKEGW